METIANIILSLILLSGSYIVISAALKIREILKLAIDIKNTLDSIDKQLGYLEDKTFDTNTMIKRNLVNIFESNVERRITTDENSQIGPETIKAFERFNYED